MLHVRRLRLADDDPDGRGGPARPDDRRARADRRGPRGRVVLRAARPALRHTRSVSGTQTVEPRLVGDRGGRPARRRAPARRPSCSSGPRGSADGGVAEFVRSIYRGDRYRIVVDIFPPEALTLASGRRLRIHGLDLWSHLSGRITMTYDVSASRLGCAHACRVAGCSGRLRRTSRRSTNARAASVDGRGRDPDRLDHGGHQPGRRAVLRRASPRRSRRRPAPSSTSSSSPGPTPTTSSSRRSPAAPRPTWPRSAPPGRRSSPTPARWST